MITNPRFSLVLVAGMIMTAGACSDAPDPTDHGLDPATLLSVMPQGGATGVDPATSIVVEFDHPLMAGMERYAAMHRGDVNGPEVQGHWALLDNGRRLVFSPDQPLAPHTGYTIHLGGGMIDEAGHHVGFDEHGPGMGGQWATGTMMGGGMMGGGGNHDHMGEGWQHPDNGSFGMIFSFTTGG